MALEKAEDDSGSLPWRRGVFTMLCAHCAKRDGFFLHKLLLRADTSVILARPVFEPDFFKQINTATPVASAA
ncbi:hypothetical protein V8J88_08380 [Massilia sp. W12]|uniref:hypothetical protein n=1 Tax=Massilia sp. W12 TaxID=3126507 RepID=UPI0030CD5DFF